MLIGQLADIHDYWGGVIAWRLTPADVRKGLALRCHWYKAFCNVRSDFRQEEINRLKL